jgi:hypothetical protein
MGTAGLRGFVRDRNYSVHGVPAVLTIPDGAPVSCTVIWLSPATDVQPTGTDIRRADARRGIAVRTSEVAALPRGSSIAVAEAPGEEAADFLVDSIDKVEHGEYRATVVRRT